MCGIRSKFPKGKRGVRLVIGTLGGALRSISLANELYCSTTTSEGKEGLLRVEGGEFVDEGGVGLNDGTT